MRVLIICTGNASRSQMAHGFLRSFDNRIGVFSAGTDAAGKVSSRAAGVMAETGIDIGDHTSDPVEKYLGEKWDYVITVCDTANRNCPAFTGSVKHRLHMRFDDPSQAKGSNEFVRNQFRRVRDEIKKQFHQLYIEVLKPQLG